MLGRLWGCLGLVALVVILLVFHPFLLDMVGQNLVSRDELRPADAIIVLAGSSPGRAAYGVRLFHERWAPRVIVSDEQIKSHGLNTTWRVLYELGIAKLDIPAEALIALPRPAENTVEEAVLSRDLLVQNGWTRVILVTDRFHSRRATSIFRTELEPYGIEVRSSPSDVGPDLLEAWWETPDQVQVVVSEYTKFSWSILNKQARFNDMLWYSAPKN